MKNLASHFSNNQFDVSEEKKNTNTYLNICLMRDFGIENLRNARINLTIIKGLGALKIAK